MPSSEGTLVTFDYEGKWGMHREAPYDLYGTTEVILDVLRRHQVNALFFVVGRLAEEEQELIELIANEGHAIGLHGYRHEHLDALSSSALASLKIELKAVCTLIEEITGTSPVAFRAPYLLWPEYSNPAVSAMLIELGFRWMSNRHIRFAEERFQPNRMPWPFALSLAEVSGLLSDRRFLGSLVIAMLNTQFLLHDPAFGSTLRRLRWLLGKREPFSRSGMIEVAIAAPLECDLLGLPIPSEATPDPVLDFATSRLIRGKQRRADPYVLTFHDWIIGTGNRTTLLDDVLRALRNEGTVIDANSWVPRLGGGVV